MLNALNSNNSRKPEHLKGNKNLLDNAKELCDGRKIITDSLKNKVSPFKRKYREDENKYEDEYKDENGPINFNSLANLVYRKERDVSKKLAGKHFLHQDLASVLASVLNQKIIQKKIKFRWV